MAVDDFTAEEQVWLALLDAYEFLAVPSPTPEQHEHTLSAVREAIKRVEEARAE